MANYIINFIKYKVLKYVLCNILIFRGKKNKNAVALTFDDGPHSYNTNSILDILKTHKIKCTFFLSGECIERNIDVARRIYEEGHEIGNHSYNHVNIRKLTFNEMFREISSCDKQIKRCGQSNVNLFRPPYGFLDIKTLWYGFVNKKKIVMWSYDSKDCFINSENELMQAIDSFKVSSGDIILLHDDSKYVRPLLEGIISNVKKEGLLFLSTSNIIT